MMRSLAEQGEPNFEVLMIDDGSEDDSNKIVVDFAKQDSRFRLWANADNRGPSMRRNQGIGAARGKYIYFADGDDELYPHALETLIDLAVQNNSDIVRGSHMFDFNNGKTAPNHFDQYHQPEVNGVSYGAMPSLVFLYTMWNMLIERQRFSNPAFRYDESLALGEDRLLAQQLFATSRSITLTKQVTYRWIRDEGASNQLSYSRSRSSRVESAHAYLSMMSMLPQATKRHRELVGAAMFWEIFLYVIKGDHSHELGQGSRNKLGAIAELMDFPDSLLLDPSVKGWSAEKQHEVREFYLEMKRAKMFPIP